MKFKWELPITVSHLLSPWMGFCPMTNQPACLRRELRRKILGEKLKK
jgi:hypothetical protein